MGSEDFLDGVPIVDLEDFLTFEEIERERNRLLSLAPRMTMAEVRIAGARLADRLMQQNSLVRSRERALLQLRGQTAIEIYSGMVENTIRPNRLKRMLNVSLSQSHEEQIVFEFTKLDRPKRQIGDLAGVRTRGSGRPPGKTESQQELSKQGKTRPGCFTAGLIVSFTFIVLVIFALIIQNAK